MTRPLTPHHGSPSAMLAALTFTTPPVCDRHGDYSNRMGNTISKLRALGQKNTRTAQLSDTQTEES